MAQTVSKQLQRSFAGHARDEADAVDFRGVFEALPEALCVRDAEGRTIASNRAARSLQKTMAAGLGSEAAERATLELPKREAYRISPAEGRDRWVRSREIGLSGAGDTRQSLLICSDVTEHQEQQSKLQAINKNLEDFASLAAHDLQTPLRHISIFSEMLEEEFGEHLPEDAAPYLAQIRDGVEEMRQLVRTFLRFMRELPSDISLSPVDAVAVIEGAADRLAMELKTAGAELVLPERPFMIMADNYLLVQVFTNLIENAIKYRDPARRLVISVDMAEVDGQVQIGVSDNGPGIDDQFSDQIFDLFGRAKPHAEIGGSGIGLALCRRIMVHHCGTIDLDRSSAEGSRFLVTLERAKAREVAA